jgi:hypothetical protein
VDAAVCSGPGLRSEDDSEWKSVTSYSTNFLVYFLLELFNDVFRTDETKKQQTPWNLVRKRTIPIERQPLIGEVIVKFCVYRDIACSVHQLPTAVNFGFLDRGLYLPFK